METREYIMAHATRKIVDLVSYVEVDDGIFLRARGRHGYKWNLAALAKLGIFAAYL